MLNSYHALFLRKWPSAVLSVCSRRSFCGPSGSGSRRLLGCRYDVHRGRGQRGGGGCREHRGCSAGGRFGWSGNSRHSSGSRHWCSNRRSSDRTGCNHLLDKF
uniref:Uncharacterized protein n=1 Tax=Gasterosteus aculeatus TaxID=69293 RepID=G3NU62_GASAC